MGRFEDHNEILQSSPHVQKLFSITNNKPIVDGWVEAELHKHAQNYFNAKNESDVVKVKSSLGDVYRTFIHKPSNQEIRVKVLPIVQKLYTSDSDASELKTPNISVGEITSQSEPSVFESSALDESVAKSDKISLRKERGSIKLRARNIKRRRTESLKRERRAKRFARREYAKYKSTQTEAMIEKQKSRIAELRRSLKSPPAALNWERF